MPHPCPTPSHARSAVLSAPERRQTRPRDIVPDYDDALSDPIWAEWERDNVAILNSAQAEFERLCRA